MGSNDEDIEKMAKILLIDFDNVVLEHISQEQEAELKIWNDIVRRDDYWVELIKQEVSNHKTYFESLSSELRKAYFMFGVACIISFVQANFTGPLISKEMTEHFEGEIFKNAHQDFSDYLTTNYEQINVNTKLPCLLAASKMIFKYCKFSPLVNVWWSWRSIIIHQQVLDELSPTLLAEATKLQSEVAALNLEGKINLT